MAKINTYKLKDGINKEDLDRLEFNEGSWQRQYKDIECMSKSIQLNKDVIMYITIKTNPFEFDDFEDTLVLDDRFCQPYIPFYGENYKKDANGKTYLGKIIQKYNKVMNNENIFEIA